MSDSSMDARLRELQRLAAGGDADARAALAGALERLGGSAAEFLAPRQVPALVEDYSDPVLYDLRHDLPVSWYSSPSAKRFVRKRSHHRHRGQVRQALREWRREEEGEA